MTNTVKLENNIEKVRKLIRDIDLRLAAAPEDVSLLMSRESTANHLSELERKLIEAENDAELVVSR